MGRLAVRRAGSLLPVLAALLVTVACNRRPEPARYELTGQILAVHPEQSQVTIAHDDIPNFMPAMTMTYPVAPASLMAGRVPGEVVKATLEVVESTGTLVAIARTGMKPIPDTSNAAGLARGLLAVGDEVPDTAFIDQQDRRRSLAEWRGMTVVVTFIYTRCPLPDYCPLMDQNFAMLQAAIVEDPALRNRVRLLSVTFDPEFDTPAVLTAHAARRRADPALWTFLTGDRPTLDRFAGKFGVGVVRSADGSIDHSLRTAIIGADGRVRHLYSGNGWTPSAVLADLRATARRP